jgi:DNA processing protein
MSGWSERTARLALAWTIEGGDPAVSEAVSVDGAALTWDRVRAGEFGDPAAARAALVDPARIVADTAGCGARFVVPGDTEWPESLADLRFCESVQRRGGEPFGLWLRGPKQLAELLARSASIVGSRACSAYGSEVAAEFAADLAETGVAVVSGGAYGIDVAAHRGALAVQGSTICVLACGVDVAYPPSNASIFSRLAAENLLVSELPPRATPTRMRFLSRNRLIAALSQGTVVVEAALRSGARNTASWALACSRPLMAVPGSVHSSLSAAPHLLIRNGQAMLVTSAAEVLEMISPAGQHTVSAASGEARQVDSFDERRMAVFEAVPARRYASAGDICLLAGVSMPVCLAELAELERLGWLQGSPDGWRVAPQRLPTADQSRH